jgi:hypothetical protein
MVSYGLGPISWRHWASIEAKARWVASAALSPRSVRNSRRTRRSVIDWGFGSLLPVGFDLGQLLVGLAHAGRSDPSALPDIDAAIFPAYLDGLVAEDYRAAPAQVRLGYLGSLAARSALSALPLELLSRPLGEDAEAEFLHRLRLTRALIAITAGITSAEPEVADGRQCPGKVVSTS